MHIAPGAEGRSCPLHASSIRLAQHAQLQRPSLAPSAAHRSITIMGATCRGPSPAILPALRNLLAPIPLKPTNATASSMPARPPSPVCWHAARR